MAHSGNDAVADMTQTAIPHQLQQRQTIDERQNQHQRNALSLQGTLARLTRNGPRFCFSANGSDTGPYLPVAKISTAPNDGSRRNMASVVREMLARSATNRCAAMDRSALNSRYRVTDAEEATLLDAHSHAKVEPNYYLVPDLLGITKAPYYWGTLNRFEADRLLDNQPEGTFLLRDSAQSEYLFSISFRRFNRTLHTRIQYSNRKFSFDSCEQDLFSADTVTALIEHYDDPTKVLIFEPLLSLPLPRKFVFPLQHLCRSVIASRVCYNDVNNLEVPKNVKDYLREYHCKDPVSAAKLD